MRIPFLVLFFLILSALPASAQSCGAISYNSDNGLAASNYLTVFQDSRGFLWVGSYSGGVSRFDGKHWQNWTTATGMLSNTIGNIIEDREGGLWFDHIDHGLSRLKDGKWQNFDYHQDTCAKGSFQFDRQQKKVFIVENGWYGKVSTRIFEYNFEIKKFLPTGSSAMPENLASHFISFEIFKGQKEEEWWIHCFNYSISQFFHSQNGQVQKLPAVPGSFEDYFRPIYSNATLSPEVGEAIMQSSKGIFILKQKQWRKIFPPPIPRYSTRDNTPALQYAGCSYDPAYQSLFIVWYLDEGANEKRYLLVEYDAINLKIRQKVLFSSIFWDSGPGRQIRKDKAGTIWVATSGNVLRLFPDRFYLPVSAPGMPSQAWGVAQAGDGNIWFSSFGQGLACFDGLYLNPQPDGLKVNKLYNDGSLTDEKGNIYFNLASQKSGILKFDGNNHWDLLAGGLNVQGFYFNRDNDGQILWGTSGHGLWILHKGKSGKDSLDWLKIDRSKGLLLDNVLTALQDRNNRYWMGRTSQGMAIYDPKTGKVLNWLRSQNPKNYGCVSMAEDTHGNLWFGTDRGLCFFENRPDIGPGFELSDHLVRVGSDFIGESTVRSCVAYDAHTLIIGNATGLHLLDLDAFYGSPSRVLLRSLNLQNGYQAGPVGQNTLIIDRDSFIWLTAANGAFRYKVHGLPRDSASPQVFLEKLIAGRDTFWDLSTSLALSSEQHYVQIFFRAPLNPMLYDNIRFEYQLTGDTSWVKILPEAESVTFPSLKPGNYRFAIRAVKEGRFSMPVMIEFRISPVLWETPLFWLLVLLLIIGIGALWWRRGVKISNQKLQISKNPTRKINQRNGQDEQGKGQAASAGNREPIEPALHQQRPAMAASAGR